MRPTIDQIKSAMTDEAQRHRLDEASCRVDSPPVVISPHAAGFNHGAKCICGHAFNIVTQHSANTPQGGGEFQAALISDYAEHFRTVMAETIFRLHEPTQ